MKKKAWNCKLSNLIGISPFAILALIGLALVLRFSLFQYTSADLEIFLIDWFQYYDKVPVQEALSHPISNYTGPYNYLLWGANFIQNLIETFFNWTIADVSMIKLINLPFEVLALISSFFIVRFYRKDSKALFLAFGLLLFYPILLINGSFWGQCDIIYTSFLLASFACLLYDRRLFGVLLFGIALSFKFQAMFFAPFLLALVFRKDLAWYELSMIPMVYIIVHIPSLMAGRGFFEILSIYFQQAESMPVLTANAANIYQIGVFENPEIVSIAKLIGIVISVLIGFVYALKIGKIKKNPIIEIDLAAASLSLMLMPYFLPSMLDRYFFAAELFLLIFAIVKPRYWFLPVLVGLASLGAYYNSYNVMLMPLNAWPVKVGAVFNGIVIAVLIWKMSKPAKKEFP